MTSAAFFLGCAGAGGRGARGDFLGGGGGSLMCGGAAIELEIETPNRIATSQVKREFDLVMADSPYGLSTKRGY
jgi:hypothetical protein